MSGKQRMSRTALWITPIIFLSTQAILTFYRGDITETKSGTLFDVYLEGGPPPIDRRGIVDTKSNAHSGALLNHDPPHINRTTAPTRHKYFWDKHMETSCFSLDHICHGSDKWFYRSTGDATKKQPTITYVQDNVTQSHGYLKVEPRIYFNVSAQSPINVDDGMCPTDPVPFHMIVQSAYNDMIGEFYSRSLVALNQLLRDNPIDAGYETKLQMYLHVIEKKKQELFEGHKLFMGGLPNNNKFDSFVSLVEDERCQCFQKLIFCGYDFEPASEYVPANRTSTKGYNALPAEYKHGDAKVFRPVGFVRSHKTLCTRKTAGKHDLKESSCYAYRHLRRDIYKTYALKDPLLSQKIIEYRRQILLEKGAIGFNTTNEEIKEWKFVGLTRRKKRRVWLNMDDSISLCDENFRKSKVVCFPVDVEDAETPEQQLLMHRALHAIVGIHGAQLTQGVLLPPHGKILELLPWIPPYLQGNWVQWTNRPTPLGIIYHKTDLNHFGYKLDRNSVPLCFNVTETDTEGLRECFMSPGHLRRFQWATRSFTVPPDVVGSFISSFVLDNESICTKMQKKAEINDFVLYNAYCRPKEEDNEFRVEHYFRED